MPQEQGSNVAQVNHRRVRDVVGDDLVGDIAPSIATVEYSAVGSRNRRCSGNQQSVTPLQAICKTTFAGARWAAQ